MTQALTTKEPISQTIMDLIQGRIKDELTKRGFTAPIRLTQQLDRRGEVKLVLGSQPFQTVPVLFREIRIADFGTSWTPDTVKVGAMFFSIRVHAMYDHFSGGSNGCELFTIQGNAHPDHDDIYTVTVN